MNNEFLGFSLFMDVQNHKIKAWNIYKTARNMRERHGAVISQQYLKKHDKHTLLKVALIGEYVRRKGEEYVKQQIRL